MSLIDKKIYIIGQGIAGSVLAFLLDRKGYTVQVIDDGHATSSSMVAAGMWNPVSFVRMSPSWYVDKLMPLAEEVYIEMEKVLGVSFFHPMDLVKIFPDNKTANKWDEHSTHPDMKDYLSAVQDESIRQQFKQPFGHGVVKHSGWLDIPAMLIALKKYFEDKGMHTISSFTKEDEAGILPLEKNALVIYCTGWKNTELFAQEVKVIPNKGEVLTIESEALQLTRMVNFGKFLIPMGNGKFRLGSTYLRDEPNSQPTEDGKSEILSYLKNHYSKDAQVSEHVSGYRPTTIDRKPIIGLHPKNQQLGFFNGFGSKGVMLIPYFAQHFIEHLHGNQQLMKEVSVERYF